MNYISIIHIAPEEEGRTTQKNEYQKKLPVLFNRLLYSFVVFNSFSSQFLHGLLLSSQT